MVGDTVGNGVLVDGTGTSVTVGGLGKGVIVSGGEVATAIKDGVGMTEEGVCGEHARHPAIRSTNARAHRDNFRSRSIAILFPSVNEI